MTDKTKEEIIGALERDLAFKVEMLRNVQEAALGPLISSLGDVGNDLQHLRTETKEDPDRYPPDVSVLMERILSPEVSFTLGKWRKLNTEIETLTRVLSLAKGEG